MFRVYTPISSDPILSVLATGADDLLGRDYAAYIVLLFGEADEAIATWFARGVCALDSLTGRNVACIVLAKRVRLRARVHMRESPRPLRGNDSAECVELSSVRRMERGERLADPTGSRWTGDQSEIAAITYAADEMARSLGIVDQLPCALFFDALPRCDATLRDLRAYGFELLPLSSLEPTEILPLLRRVMADCDRDSGLEAQHRLVREAREAETRLDANLQEIRQLEWRLENLQQSVLAPVEQARPWVTEARTALARAATRQFRHILRHRSTLSGDVAFAIADRFAAAQPRLTRVLKTADSLRYYGQMPLWGDADQQKANQIVATHAAALLGLDLPGQITPAGCLRLAHALDAVSETLIADLSEGIPSLEDMTREALTRIAPEAKRIEDEIQAARDRRNSLFDEHSLALQAASREGRASVARSVKRALESRPRAAIDRGLDQSIAAKLRTFNWAGALPPIVAGSVSIGEVNLGDRYSIGQAGAVGPRAQAQHMIFSTSAGFDASLAEAGTHVTDGLIADIARLRSVLRDEAESNAEVVAVGEMSLAESAAARYDYDAVARHLARAGSWPLGVAERIGAAHAQEAIRRVLARSA